MRNSRSISGRRLIALTLSLVLFAAVFVWDIPSSFAEEPPAESPSAAPTETVEPEPTETLVETPAPTEKPSAEPSEVPQPEPTQTPAETPAPKPEPTQDVLPEMPDSIQEALSPETAMEPDAMMEADAIPGDYDYADNGDGTVTITGYHGEGGNITIPSTLDGKAVTAIGGFGDNNSIIGAKIQEGITNILDGAFEYCQFMETVDLPLSLVSIGDYAFNTCYHLKNISIPRNVIYIGKYALSRCYYLEEINVDQRNTSYCSEDGVLFNITKSTLMQYPPNNQRDEYAIPSSVLVLDGFSFMFCRNLRNITIPYGLITIGEQAFHESHVLENVIIPESVTEIGEYAFRSCYCLKSLILPSTVKVIKFGMCEGCQNLNQLIIPEGVIRIEDFAFLYCGISSLKVPKSVQYIGGSAFTLCENLTHVLFLGDAPEVGAPNMGDDGVEYDVFDCCEPDFVVYYLNGAAGFSNPWHDYPTVECDPNKSYTVTFDSQGGSPVNSVTDGPVLVISEPNTPTRTGYDFIGWYPTPQCNTDPASFPFAVIQNTTLFAKWRGHDHTITFHTQGAMSAPKTICAPYGTVIESVPAPIRFSDYFAGWYPTPVYDTAPISFPYTLTGDANFYAKWQRIGPYISNLILSAGKLSRDFYNFVYKYSIFLGENEQSVTLTPDIYPGASMTINGKAVSSTTVTLANGKSKTVTVKVKYGKKSNTYKFTVTRAKSGDNNLASLTNTAGVLSQPFDPSVTNYTLNLDENTKSVTLKAARSNAMARVSPASKKLTLKNGQTKVLKFTVKAQSGAKKTYTVTVTRAPSTNTSLKTLKANIPLSPGFSAGVTDYTVTLPADKSAVTISAKAFDRLSKVTINGAKKYSQKVTLANGQSTTLSIVVTSQAGTAKEYRVLIQRQ